MLSINGEPWPQRTLGREGAVRRVPEPLSHPLGWGRQSWGARHLPNKPWVQPPISPPGLGSEASVDMAAPGDGPAWVWVLRSHTGRSLCSISHFYPNTLAWDTSKCRVCVWHSSASQDGGWVWGQGPDGRRCAYKQHVGGWHPADRVSLISACLAPSPNLGRDQQRPVPLCVTWSQRCPHPACVVHSCQSPWRQESQMRSSSLQEVSVGRERGGGVADGFWKGTFSLNQATITLATFFLVQVSA